MLKNLFYFNKPLIPRKLQLFLRRKLVLSKLSKHKNVWPILKGSEKKPEGFSGWPDKKQFALVLTHDVEHKKGYDRVLKLMQVEKELGFVSSFNFIPERDYIVEQELLDTLKENGFEFGVHGLHHDGKLFSSERIFLKRSKKINEYLENWKSVGFRAPAMHHNLDWIGELNISYDMSTFDTDPFEPQPDGVGTIFPFWVPNKRHKNGGYVELPYTLPQDFTIFTLMREKTIKIWQEKTDWIAENGGMVLLNVHPDYISFNDTIQTEEFSIEMYRSFLNYISTRYKNNYWNVLPSELALFWNTIPKNNNRPSLKKVLMIAQSFYDYDARILRQTSTLIQNNIDVDIICLGMGDYLKYEKLDNVNVHRIMKKFQQDKVLHYVFFSIIFLFKSMFKTWMLMIKKKPDIIQIHNMPDYLVFTAFLHKLVGIPVVLDIHDLTVELFKEKWGEKKYNLLRPVLVFTEKLSVKFADKVITVSEQCGERLQERKVPKEKLTIVMNVADSNNFKYNKERKFEKIEKNLKLIYHGTIAERYGIHHTIVALPLVLEKIPGSEFRILGNFDSEYGSSLKRLAEDLEIEDNVRFDELIPYDKVNEEFKKQILAIITQNVVEYSNFGIPTKAYEYAASGLPFIINDLPVNRSVFEEESVSFIRHDNTEHIAREIIDLALNPERRKKMSENAYSDLQRISVDNMNARYLKLINSLITNN